MNADPDSVETWVDDGLANTINGFDVGDIRTTHAVIEPASYGFDWQRGNDAPGAPLLEKRGRSGHPLASTTSMPVYEEQSPGLGATRVPAAFVAGVAENQRGEVLETDYSHQLTSGGGKPGQGYGAVREGGLVRRLTPIECERLQGFPDGWTEGESDSTRYRMLGNAVCVPVAEWIGRKMLEAHNG